MRAYCFSVGDGLEAFSHEEVEAQRAVCARFGAQYVPTPPDLKVGISLVGDVYPVNGYRESEDPAYDELSGWWIWNGERKVSDWDALHAAHLAEQRPDVVAYLGLPPGWHFLLAPGYEDVWFDPKTLQPGD